MRVVGIAAALILFSLARVALAQIPDPEALEAEARPHYNSGRHQAAEPLVRGALAARELLLGPDHPDVALSLYNLALVLKRQGRFKEAEPLLRRSLTIREQALVAAPGPISFLLVELADILWRDRRLEEAEPLLRRNLAIREAVIGPTSAYAADALQMLARLLADQGRFAEAEPMFKRSLNIKEAAFGIEDRRVLRDRERLASQLRQNKRAAEAEPLYRQNLAIAERSLGPAHPEVGRLILELGAVLVDLERYAEAEEHARRGLAVHEQAHGPEHGEVVSALNLLSLSITRQRRYAEAEQVMRRSLATWNRLYGQDDPGTPTMLDNLAHVLEAQGRHAEALEHRRRGLALREKNLGPESSEVAKAFNRLAMALGDRGRFAEALPLQQRSLDIGRKTLDLSHPDLAFALNDFARLHVGLGRLAEARDLAQQALTIRERSFGPEHPLVAESLNNIGVILEDLGRNSESESLHRRSLTIREQVHGLDHASVAESLGNLASSLVAQGRLEEAEPIQRRSLAIRESKFGADHIDVAAALNNLALLLKDTGRSAEAEPLLRRSLAINLQALGPAHPKVATLLSNFASLLEELGRQDETEPLRRRSLAIVEEAFGPDHPMVASYLYGLGNMLRERGRDAEAEPLLARSAAIFEAVLGDGHPRVAAALAHLALVHTRQGRTREGLELYRRATAIEGGRHDRNGRGAESGGASQAERRQATGLFSLHLQTAARLAASASAEERRRLHEEAFALVDRVKAAAAGIMVSRMAARFASGNSRLANLVREEQDAAEGLAQADRAQLHAASRPPAERDIGAEQELRARRVALQGQLSALRAWLRADFASYAEIANPRPPNVGEAQALLGEDEALIAFVSLSNGTLVFALRRDRFEVVEARIGQAELAEAVTALRAGLDPTGLERISDLPPFEASTAFRLYSLLFGSVAHVLTGTKHLFVVPDGALDSLPVGALLAEAPSQAQWAPDDFARFREGAWLGRRMAVSVLPSIGSLRALRRFAREARASKPFLGIGDPVLKDHPSDPAALRARGAKPASGERLLGLTEGPPRLRSLFRGAAADPEAIRAVPSLPETATELAAMAQSVRAQDGSLLLRHAATESAVKRAELTDYKLLAFATHGVVAGELTGLVEPALILTPPAEPSAEDDGLLTASEVAELKLDADWVILSACNTAAADGTVGADGLSGLAKAFFYAGARALLVSHWPVVSQATVHLTTSMLEESAKPGVTRAEAHRRAMSGMIENADRPEFAHPLFWAPFVVVGEGGRAAR